MFVLLERYKRPMAEFPNQLPRVRAQGDRRAVATLITGVHLSEAISAGGFIKHGVENCVEGAKYDFRMSPLILKSSYGAPINLERMTEEQRAQVRVEPGEVVFVRTIEWLELPNDVTAVLSTKRKLSHQGIIALGGFCVDPLYKGPLFVGLYNFSSTPFVLQAGKKLIAALFYRLADDELADFPVPEAVPEDDFPDELKSLIRNYKPFELKGLTETVATLQAHLVALQEEIRDDRSWKRDFQEALASQTKQIDKLLEGLQEEKAARKEEDSAIRSKLDSMSNIFTSAKLIWAIVWTLVVLLLGGVIGNFIPKIFSSSSSPTPQLSAPPPLQSPSTPPGPGKP
jgi:deoxycytidine triphosphate deaminase